MTLEMCPRCKGMGWELKGKPTPTLRVENVMGSTQMIHYKCSKCCYAERRPYGDEDKLQKKHYEQVKLT